MACVEAQTVTTSAPETLSIYNGMVKVPTWNSQSPPKMNPKIKLTWIEHILKRHHYNGMSSCKTLKINTANNIPYYMHELSQQYRLLHELSQ